jgi:hypothetical protein
MNRVTTVTGFLISTIKPRSKKVLFTKCQNLNSQTPLKRFSDLSSPHSVPSHLYAPVFCQMCGVYAVVYKLVSQISISAQHIQ